MLSSCVLYVCNVYLLTYHICWYSNVVVCVFAFFCALGCRYNWVACCVHVCVVLPLLCLCKWYINIVYVFCLCISFVYRCMCCICAFLLYMCCVFIYVLYLSICCVVLPWCVCVLVLFAYGLCLCLCHLAPGLADAEASGQHTLSRRGSVKTLRVPPHNLIFNHIPVFHLGKPLFEKWSVHCPKLSL